MPDPSSLKFLSNNDSKFSVSEPRCAQSIIAVLSAAVSVLKTSNQKWLRYHNYAFPARNHRSRSKKLELTLFGPFFIVNGGKTEKHYGINFNCFVSRVCHLESWSCMTTDSFLNVFRRFIARRRHPRLLRSDNGKNFVRARRELQACLNDGIAAVQNKIPHAEEVCWEFNPPSAPHFGGPWERMIQTAKRTLLIILCSQKLTLEFFTTILAETELMLNSRPLTHVSDQPESDEPLTPNHFLPHCPFANMPSIVFEETDQPLSFNSWKKV